MGVGIVRAVDMAQGCIYVLAPLDLGSMQKINVLQVCYLLPIGMYLEKALCVTIQLIGAMQHCIY